MSTSPDQKSTHPERLTTKGIVADITRDLTNSDRGMWGTFVQLTLRPDLVVDTYLEGDRTRFVKPTRYVVFTVSVAALYFLAVQYWYGSSIGEMASAAMQEFMLASVQDSLSLQDARSNLSPEDLAQRQAVIDQLVTSAADSYALALEYYSVFILAIIPLAGAMLRGIFVLNRFTVAEAIIAAIYIGAHATLLYFLTLPLLLLGHDIEGFIFWTTVAQFINLIYTVYSVHKVFATRLWEWVSAAVLLALLFTAGLILARLLGSFVFLIVGLVHSGNLFQGVGFYLTALAYGLGIAVGVLFFRWLFWMRFRDHFSKKAVVITLGLFAILLSLRVVL